MYFLNFKTMQYYLCNHLYSLTMYLNLCGKRVYDLHKLQLTLHSFNIYVRKILN